MPVRMAVHRSTAVKVSMSTARPWGTRGDLHLVHEEGMLLIGANVRAEVIRPKTFIERNAYLKAVHQLVQPFLSRIGRRPGSGTSTSTCLRVLSPGGTTPLIVAMTFLLIG
jgi:hypothetical protein